MCVHGTHGITACADERYGSTNKSADLISVSSSHNLIKIFAHYISYLIASSFSCNWKDFVASATTCIQRSGGCSMQHNQMIVWMVCCVKEVLDPDVSNYNSGVVTHIFLISYHCHMMRYVVKEICRLGWRWNIFLGVLWICANLLTSMLETSKPSKQGWRKCGMSEWIPPILRVM